MKKYISRSFQKTTNDISFKSAPSFCEYLQKTRLFENEDEVIKNFDTLTDEIRDWLQTKGFKQAEILLKLMLERNDGETRKDDKTHSALHETTQALWFISCIEDGLHVNDVEGVLSVILTHDLGEDFNITPKDIETYLLEHGVKPASKLEQFKTDFDVITKRYGKNGVPKYKNDAQYYEALQNNKNASIAKLFDKIHNLATLVGIKNKENMEDYIYSTNDFQESLVKYSGNKFSSQKEIYKNLSKIIKQEIKICCNYISNKCEHTNYDLNFKMPDKGFRNLPLGFHPVIIPDQRIWQTCPESDLNKNIIITDDNGTDIS